MRAAAKAAEIPGLRATARRIAAWRATRRDGAAMPQALWCEAIELAHAHGLYRTARGLRVDFGKLKRLLEKATDPISRRGQRSGATFVDIGAASELTGAAEASSVPAGTTVVELRLATGDRLTIRIAAGQQLDIAQVIRDFRGRR